MSVDTQRAIQALMLEFRELVLGAQEEHSELKNKIARSLSPRGSTSTSTPTASPTDEPSTATTNSTHYSSETLPTSNSTRPPPYNSIILDNQSYSPKPPHRTRRLRTLKSTMSQAPKISRGALIVLEGLDRVGKTTLARKLVDYLKKSERKVVSLRFPDRSTRIGRCIDELLRDKSKHINDHAMHLLFSANRRELEEEIRFNIASGATVVVDRYAYSGIAYSSASRNLPFRWCCETEKGLPKPDLVIFLELSKESQYRREGFGDERFETKELQERIRNQYKKIIERSQERWLRVNVENKTPDQLLVEISPVINVALESSSRRELGDLEFTP